MKKQLLLSIIFISLLVGCSGNGSEKKADYQCPMDTAVHSEKPSKCPDCGMDLEKK